jgi:2-iminobutanoate/2-iminopropanoate deaminase
MPKKQACFPGEDVRGGPYSPALAVGDQVFIAGQGPISPDTQQITGDTFEEQVELTFSNVSNALRAAGCELDDCVKVTVYLSDMANFSRFNEIYKTKFAEPYLVRTTIQVITWRHIQVEIDVIAIRGCGEQG